MEMTDYSSVPNQEMQSNTKKSKRKIIIVGIIINREELKKSGNFQIWVLPLKYPKFSFYGSFVQRFLKTLLQGSHKNILANQFHKWVS